MYKISDLGLGLGPKTNREILFGMAQIVFSNSLFNNFLKQRDISQRAREENKLRADSTFERRLQTVKSWKSYFEKIFQPPYWKA